MLKPKQETGVTPGPVVEAPEEVSEETLESAAAVDRPEAQPGSLGTTVVSLGDATQAGSWLKTPLVANTRPGKVWYNGRWAAVTLIPIEGESGSGSRMSLQAMQLLSLPLTGLTEVEVTAD
ncbi:hypothetical protein [Shimia isoporae]|nr:hypothetical protein [Shimia isoporae]